jgi:putative ABC transport system permease protein
VYARLKPDVTIAAARADIQAIGDELGRRFPEAVGASRPLLLPLQEDLVHDIRTMLLLLLGAVGCVLLIASANIANLTLERALRRQRELVIRAALGASRWQLVRQMLVESAVLAVLGGGLGLLLAVWGVDLISALYPPHVAFSLVGPITFDTTVLVFTAAVTLGTGVVFGLVPALLASRHDLARALKDADHHASAGGRHLRARNLLVVVEVALAMMLSVGAALATRSLGAVSRVDPGFDASSTLSAATNLSPDLYPTSEKFMAFWTELERRVAAMPGVVSVAVSSGMPSQLGAYGVVYPMGASRTPENSFTALVYRTGPGFVETLRIPLLAGRTCGAQDGPGTQPVVVIDQRLADKFFPGQNAVGQRLQDDLTKLPSVEVVGVVGHILHDGLGTPDRTPYQVYYCYRQLSFAAQSDDALGMIMHIVVRTAGDPIELAPQLMAAATELEPTSSLWGVDTVENTLRRTLGHREFTAKLLAGFAAVALLLAALGLYAVMANTVARRTRELGVRMALGAQPGAVVGLVVRQGLGLVAVGLALGMVGAYALSQTMTEILSEQVAASDPPSYLGVTVLLVAVSLLAMIVPARRATRIDPMIALRHD